jgi:hypothetical protein
MRGGFNGVKVGRSGDFGFLISRPAWEKVKGMVPVGFFLHSGQVRRLSVL